MDPNWSIAYIKKVEINGLLSAIAISPSNERIMYMGSGGGGMWKSMNGGYAWLPLFDRELSLGIGEPAGIAIDPNNSNILYLELVTVLVRAQRQNGWSVRLGFLSQLTEVRVGFVSVRNYPLGNTGNADRFTDQNINVS